MAVVEMSACTHVWLSLWIAALLVAVPLTESAVIIVGGSKGWITGFDYEAWATSQNIQIRVGDTIVFVNPDHVPHTVGLLNSADAYQRCILGGSSPIYPVPMEGNFSMTVPPGLEGQTLYAACTIGGHCTEGQKLQGTVLPALTATAPAAAPAGASPTTSKPPASPNPSDADMNRYICWTTAILLVVACFWGPLLS